MDLKLELNPSAIEETSPLVVELRGRAVSLDFTPPIGEDYYLARVQLGGGQAVVCFPKFGTIGIGFQQEEDWNTNLPYTCDAVEIYDHIKHNRGKQCRAKKAMVVQAIEMLRDFARRLTACGPGEEIS